MAASLPEDGEIRIIKETYDIDIVKPKQEIPNSIFIRIGDKYYKISIETEEDLRHLDEAQYKKIANKIIHMLGQRGIFERDLMPRLETIDSEGYALTNAADEERTTKKSHKPQKESSKFKDTTKHFEELAKLISGGRPAEEPAAQAVSPAELARVALQNRQDVAVVAAAASPEAAGTTGAPEVVISNVADDALPHDLPGTVKIEDSAHALILHGDFQTSDGNRKVFLEIHKRQPLFEALNSKGKLALLQNNASFATTSSEFKEMINALREYIDSRNDNDLEAFISKLHVIIGETYIPNTPTDVSRPFTAVLYIVQTPNKIVIQSTRGMLPSSGKYLDDLVIKKEDLFIKMLMSKFGDKIFHNTKDQFVMDITNTDYTDLVKVLGNLSFDDDEETERSWELAMKLWDNIFIEGYHRRMIEASTRDAL